MIRESKQGTKLFATSLHNKYWGRTCIVVGNGPSLADVPLEFLNQYPTIGSNYTFFKPGWQPTIYTISSHRVLTNENGMGYEWVTPTVRNAEVAFITNKGIHAFGTMPNVYPLNPLRGAFCFSRAPHKWVFIGANSTIPNLQFAFFLGFATIYLVGVDHNYEKWKQGKAHCHPDYPVAFGVRPILMHPKGRQLVNRGFLLCHRMFDDHNRTVINLTLDSLLPYFQKGTLKLDEII